MSGGSLEDWRSNMKRYQVVDYYDMPYHGDVIGEFDDLDQAKRYAKMHIKECDGECDVEIREVEVIK